MSKKLLLIAAVAVMLVGATSAYGYYEGWNGWFKDGYLNYNSKRYTIVESYNTVDDSTYIPLTLDTFYLTVDVLTFVCAAGYNDSIFVCIPTFTGGKPYGTTGEKDGWGFWSGAGYSDRSAEPETKLFDFGGTWEVEFDYTPLPHDDPTCEGTWMVTWSGWPVPVGGIGSSSGERTYYIP